MNVIIKSSTKYKYLNYNVKLGFHIMQALSADMIDLWWQMLEWASFPLMQTQLVHCIHSILSPLSCSQWYCDCSFWQQKSKIWIKLCQSCWAKKLEEQVSELTKSWSKKLCITRPVILLGWVVFAYYLYTYSEKWVSHYYTSTHLACKWQFQLLCWYSFCELEMSEQLKEK